MLPVETIDLPQVQLLSSVAILLLRFFLPSKDDFADRERIVKTSDMTFRLALTTFARLPK